MRYFLHVFGGQVRGDFFFGKKRSLAAWLIFKLFYFYELGDQGLILNSEL